LRPGAEPTGWKPQGPPPRTLGQTLIAPYGVVKTGTGLKGENCGTPHLAKNERDAPNFLYAALDRTACAPLFKERRMKFREPRKLHRKSGMWGTRRLRRG
jgi:hypothetical protein